MSVLRSRQTAPRPVRDTRTAARRAASGVRVVFVVAMACVLASCFSTPPAPAWQMDAKSSLDRGASAWLAGDTRVANAEYARARGAIASTGRLDLLARAELFVCAAQVASLVVEPCERFEALRNDAAPAERAYADYLQGRVAPQSIAQLPAAQRGVAAKAADEKGAAAALRDIEDPLSRLVAAGVLFRSGHASPAVLTAAVDTASAQGWRRPLLAWLGVQRKRAEQAGDAAAVARLQRQMDLVEQGAGAPK